MDGRWYYSRREIEENSPSRRDGISLKKETFFRKSYCTFLRDLGIRLKVPQLTIATSTIFCHRFFLRQSHSKHDRMTIATACMFLAAKVEETPRALRDVILVSYEILHNKDPEAMKRIKQVEAVYKEEKEKLLVSETLVMATLGFDLHVRHPYKYLVEGMKKLKISRNEFAQVAWNLVSDGLHTSLYLQFEPRFIAAASIYLAARFLKVDFPSHWWKDFDVSPAQLEEISDQMMELYEQNSGQIPQSSQASEAECSSTAVRTPPRLPSRGPGNTNEERYKDDERGLGNGVEFGAEYDEKREAEREESWSKTTSNMQPI